MRALLAAALLLLPLAAGAAAAAPEPAGATEPAFDAGAATDALLASVPAEARARTDAYFEGGYWLQLVDYLAGAALGLALLASGLSRRLRDWAARRARSPLLQSLLYWMPYLLLTSAVLLPLSIYEGWFREHQYGLSNQSLGEWFGDQAKGLAVGLLLGGLAVALLYAVARRLPRSWAAWGTVAAMALLVFSMVIGPVYLAPLFNTYTRLEEPAVKEPILRLARAQGVPSADVWVADASRQSKRVSANVSGLLGSLRITLNDNLLHRCSLAEIESVMAHELGHYVLNHVEKSLLFFALLIAGGFAFLRLAFDRLVARFGGRWGVRGIADPAGLPLVVLLFSTWLLVMAPLANGWIRVQEAEADLFALNAAGQPDGEAQADLMLGEYRKLDPGPLEEALLYDHPGGRSRIMMATRWKAEHQEEARRGYSAATAAAWLQAHQAGAR